MAAWAIARTITDVSIPLLDASYSQMFRRNTRGNFLKDSPNSGKIAYSAKR
jgi:hypothetical protein